MANGGGSEQDVAEAKIELEVCCWVDAVNALASETLTLRLGSGKSSSSAQIDLLVYIIACVYQESNL